MFEELQDQSGNENGGRENVEEWRWCLVNQRSLFFTLNEKRGEKTVVFLTTGCRISEEVAVCPGRS